VTTRSKSQIFVIPSISDSTYTENHKYLRFVTSFLTLGGNLLRVNHFFSICVCDTQITNEIWECSIYNLFVGCKTLPIGGNLFDVPLYIVFLLYV